MMEPIIDITQHQQLDILVDFHNSDISEGNEWDTTQFILRNCKPELAQTVPSVVPGELAEGHLSVEQATDALNNLFETYRGQYRISWFESDKFKQFTEAHQNTRRTVSDLLDNRYHPYIHEWLNRLKAYLEGCELRGRMKGYSRRGKADSKGYFSLDEVKLQVLRQTAPGAVHRWCGLYGVLTRIGWSIHDGFQHILQERLVSAREQLIIEHWPTSGIIRVIELGNM